MIFCGLRSLWQKTNFGSMYGIWTDPLGVGGKWRILNWNQIRNGHDHHDVRNFCYDFFENYRVLHKLVQVLRKGIGKKSDRLSDTKLKKFFEQKREWGRGTMQPSPHRIWKPPNMSHLIFHLLQAHLIHWLKWPLLAFLRPFCSD